VPTAAAPTGSGGIVECLDEYLARQCPDIARAVGSAVAPSGWTVIRIWISSGMLCPQESCLFDPDHNFPYPLPPAGGQWVANAEVAFSETDRHAGLNVAQVGSNIVTVLIGYRAPLLKWCSGGCPSSATTDGTFRLELVLPHLDWRPTDPITGTAILSFAGNAPTTVYGSGGGVIGYSYVARDGSHDVEPAWTADCGPHVIEPATPISVGLSKSGAFGASDPDAPFLRSFFAAADVHLPAGTWDITALADFFPGAGCAGDPHHLAASLTIVVH